MTRYGLMLKLDGATWPRILVISKTLLTPKRAMEEPKIYKQIAARALATGNLETWGPGNLEIWGTENPEIWGPTTEKITFSKFKSVLPKMSARSGFVGKK